MSIIIENQNVNAGVAVHAGALFIEFADEPAMVLGETVLIDLMQRSIGIIYQNTYHHIGELPEGMKGKDVARLTEAHLQGFGAEGRSLQLHAPVRIVKN
jgi:hypothetical protein